MRQIEIFDTTMRDGQQGIGFLMSKQQKLSLLKKMVLLNIKFIELGMLLTDEDEEVFSNASEIDINDSIIVALCRLNNDDIKRSIKSLSKFESGMLNLLCVGSELHVNKKFGKTEKEIIEMTKRSIDFTTNLTSNNNVKLCAILEDSTRGGFGFLEEMIGAIYSSGIDDICLADTTGRATPIHIQKLLIFVQNIFPKVNFSIHCHNDLGLAVANTITAIDNGANKVQVTLGGVGERCGNASFEELIAILLLTNEYKHYSLDISIKKVVELCDYFFSLMNKSPHENKPIIGNFAFSTCAGIHQRGILKDPETYEFINPEDLGRTRKFYYNLLSSRHINFNSPQRGIENATL